jgi:hypothetical protein
VDAVDPYPAITTWAVGAGVIRETLAAVDPRLRPRCEAGVFWLGRRRAEARVDAVVVPIGDGVEQLPGRWRVTAAVFGQISTWATDSSVQLLAVGHTHGGPSPATLSRRDRTHSIKAPGVLAVVIAHNGGETDPAHWAWYVWERSDYRLLDASERRDRVRIDDTHEPTVWRADVHGVHPY